MNRQIRCMNKWQKAVFKTFALKQFLMCVHIYKYIYICMHVHRYTYAQKSPRVLIVWSVGWYMGNLVGKFYILYYLLSF